MTSPECLAICLILFDEDGGKKLSFCLARADSLKAVPLLGAQVGVGRLWSRDLIALGAGQVKDDLRRLGVSSLAIAGRVRKSWLVI
jgi:hypothetical protein